MAKTYFKNNGTDYTRRLAQFVADLSYDNIPAEVIERAKLMTLHTLGVSLAARNDELAGNSVKVAEASNNGDGGTATIWTTGKKMTPANAAFVNGTVADILDWEDCAWTGHPSAGVIPVAAAVAEDTHATGKEYLESVVSAYEVYQRVAMAVQPAPDFDHNQGWALCNWQIFAACTPAAKLLKLSPEEINQTFGMSCMFAEMPTNMQQATMSNAYHYQHGQSAQSGILAALCAQNGVVNMQDCFDIPYGYCEQLTKAVDRTWLDRDMDRFLMLQILIKHWPANMWVQTPVEIVSEMVKKYGIQAADVEEIVVNPPTQYRMHCPEGGFSSLMEAQFSMPFVIASYLLDPVPGPHWFTPDRFADPKVMELAKRVKSGPDKEHSLLESFHIYQSGSHPMKTVTITTKGGKTYSMEMGPHKGHPLNMLTRDEFCELFRLNAGVALPPDKVEKLMNFVLNVETVEDMASFGDLLRA
ncbi:MAG: MmgE/PrpD family protein [Clostridia bacterium]|nr:MmgE/PrpD family protein [Clostridia bacterium]